jgi:4-carboxymuconolactone decarboxylase
MAVRIPLIPLDQMTPQVRELALASSNSVGGAPAIFGLFAHHPRLFIRWAKFGGALLLNSGLDRRQVEILVLRSAANCDCVYEWDHHVKLAAEAGVSPEEISFLNRTGQSDRIVGTDAILVRAADELHQERQVSDGTWSELDAIFTADQIIEICMLVGHYEMLAMLLNSVGLESD